MARPADNIDNMAWHTKKYTFPAGVVTKDQKKAHGKAKSKADKKGTTKAQRKEQIRLRTIENARMSSKKKATDKRHACQHCHKKFRKQLDLQSHVKDRHGAYGKAPALRDQSVPPAHQSPVGRHKSSDMALDSAAANQSPLADQPQPPRPATPHVGRSPAKCPPLSLRLGTRSADNPPPTFVP